MKSAYSGPARGFRITIGGASAPNPVRIGFTQSANTTGIVSPHTQVTGPGTYDVLFNDATCPTWATSQGCTPATAATSFDVQIQVPGGDAAGSGQLCITSVQPIL